MAETDELKLPLKTKALEKIKEKRNEWLIKKVDMHWCSFRKSSKEFTSNSSQK